ncbi:MAG: DUF3048 domain-containing protein [Lachnospiraceae bacterium]|nr:DUF3048 domain-containing protein [Lachnospiraceae bacterium]
MKKGTLLVFLAALIACFSLVACGGSSETEEAAAPSVTDISEEEETEEEEVAEEEVVEEEETREGYYRSELTNEWIDESLQSQRPVAIMVDNEKTALYHYGLTQADIVYEMMNSTANGEITRFMAIVKDYASITQFGSIRSVRPTNFMIAPEYNAVVIHDGGPYYIDAFLENDWVDHLSGGFSRINNGKSREFTEYVTTGEIEDRMESAGIDVDYNEYYQGAHWQFASESNPVDLGDASDSLDCVLVDLPFDHNGSQLDYDEESGTYLYSEYGMAHIDLANDSKQLAFTNVIIQCASHTQYDSNGYMQFNIINESGEGYYITGGKAIPVTWSKGHDMEPTKFYDADGNEITLNTGKTYIALVSTTRWDELVLE